MNWSKLSEFIEVYNKLGYTNKAVLQLREDILRESYKQNKRDIVISKTGEGELLIYRVVNDEYRNIIIDEDADIEYMNIPANREDTINEYFPFKNSKDGSIVKLVEKF